MDILLTGSSGFLGKILYSFFNEMYSVFELQNSKEQKKIRLEKELLKMYKEALNESI